MKKILAILCVSLLFGCAVTPKSPAQAVFAAEQNYAVALSAAVAYKKLPPCVANAAVTLCADAKVVGQLQAADVAAYALLQGAQATVRTGGGNVQLAVAAAEQAVLALSTIVKTLGVK